MLFSPESLFYLTSHTDSPTPPPSPSFQNAASSAFHYDALGEHAEGVVAPCWTRSAKRSLVFLSLAHP